jgi:hypothetical protein
MVEAAGVELFSVLTARKLLILRMAGGANSSFDTLRILNPQNLKSDFSDTGFERSTTVAGRPSFRNGLLLSASLAISLPPH